MIRHEGPRLNLDDGTQMMAKSKEHDLVTLSTTSHTAKTQRHTSSSVFVPLRYHLSL
jgi:hypothetical protein